MRRQPDRRPHVIGEDVERWLQTAEMPPCRAMPFSTAPMACSRIPKWKLRLPAAGPIRRSFANLEQRVGGRSQVRRTADQRRHARRHRVEHLPGSLTRGRSPRVGRESFGRRRPSLAAVRAFIACCHSAARSGKCRGVCTKRCRSIPRREPGPCDDGLAEMIQRFVGDKKRRLDGQPSACLVSFTSSAPSGEPCASAVSCLFGAAVGDVRCDADQRRPIDFRSGVGQRAASRP